MRLSANTRLKIIKSVKSGSTSVTKACKQAGISRKTFYKWLKRYESASEGNKSAYLEDKKWEIKQNPRKTPINVERAVINLVIRKSQWGYTNISKQLKASGINVSRHAIINIFRRYNLKDPEVRQALAQEKSQSGLTPQERYMIFTGRIHENKSVSSLCREFGISRKTYYKWYKRYQEKGNLSLATFTDKKWQIQKHPRKIDKETEKKILAYVLTNPQLSSHKLAQVVGIGNHGVQKVLERNNLNLLERRQLYARSRYTPELAPIQPDAIDRPRSVWEQFIPSLAPAPPPAFYTIVKYFSVSLFSSFIFFLVFGSWLRLVFGSGSLAGVLGIGFASLALLMGSFFFLYSLKYYLTLAIVLSFSQQEGERGSNGLGGRLVGRKGIISMILGLGNTKEKGKAGPVGLEPNLSHITLKRHPYVSVQIPLYNEKNVVERLLKASTSFEYQGEYEVILCDDSTDGTTAIIRSYQQEYLTKGKTLNKVTNTQEGWELSGVEIRPGVTLKHLHRTSRSGFKGGALSLALKLCDPRTEFISVFDADFVPYPDTLNLFLKYFKLQNNLDEDYTKTKVAAVQGYQWHVLNKSENWITRGVRSEYAGSYVIERSGTEIYGGLKQISGSVYMIRKDVLQEIGWATSITEDFELTLKLYNAGYKVVYTPYIQAPAECVSTLKRLIRQRMRWAEGHSHNIKKMFGKLMTNPKLTVSEKLEFLYLTPYYLQAFFFIVGTLSWLISESIFKAHLPFWTSLWGWSLVLTNMLALPLMNAVGLFLEESEEKDYGGIAAFVALSYIVVPFQAYAALKGFLEQAEGPWFRTPKTGRITDIFTRGRFYRFISGILPGVSPAPSSGSLSVKYLSLRSANNRFNSFSVKSGKHKWIGKLGISFVLILTLLINSLTFFTPAVQAYDANWLYRKRLTISGTTAGAQTDFQMEIDVFSGSGSDSGKNVYCTSHCNSDFSDVRFVKSDGTSDLDYWRQSYVSSTSAIFWVEVDSIPASPSTVDIYMYYGYSSATTTSNGVNTFVFFDNFDDNSLDTNKWNKRVELGTITEQNGRMENGGGITSGNYGHTALDSKSLTDFRAGIVEGSLYLATDGISEIGFRGGADNTGYKNRADARSGQGVGHLEPPYSGWNFLSSGNGAASGTAVGTGAWKPFKLTVYDNGSTCTMQTIVDGQTKNSSDTSYATQAGRISLQNHYGSYTYYDDVRVRKYASPEPGYSSWGSEEEVPEFAVLLAPLALIAPFVVKSFERKRKALAAYPVK